MKSIRFWKAIGIGLLIYLFFTVLFGFIYYKTESVKFASCIKWPDCPTKPDYFDCLYFSVVTFGTMGTAILFRPNN